MIRFGVNFRLMPALQLKRLSAARLPFRNHTGSVPETWRSPSAPNAAPDARKTGFRAWSFAGGAGALAFA
jgi:hypothetical protein